MDSGPRDLELTGFGKFGEFKAKRVRVHLHRQTRRGLYMGPDAQRKEWLRKSKVSGRSAYALKPAQEAATSDGERTENCPTSDRVTALRSAGTPVNYSACGSTRMQRTVVQRIDCEIGSPVRQE